MAGGAGARVSQAGVGDSQPSPPSTPPPAPHVGKPWWSRGQASSYLRPSVVRRRVGVRREARSEKRVVGLLLAGPGAPGGDLLSVCGLRSVGVLRGSWPQHLQN